MAWSFVPLVDYHAGGSAAAFDPMSQHLEDYANVLAQTFGSGLSACWRGYQVNKANFKALLIKELRVGGLNGIIWAIVIAIVASIWFDSAAIGFVIGVAILINICAAALSGVIVPVMLDKLKLDPALSGAVILTTVTDIVGFVAFLGLGSLVLL